MSILPLGPFYATLGVREDLRRYQSDLDISTIMYSMKNVIKKGVPTNDQVDTSSMNDEKSRGRKGLASPGRFLKAHFWPSAKGEKRRTACISMDDLSQKPYKVAEKQPQPVAQPQTRCRQPFTTPVAPRDDAEVKRRRSFSSLTTLTSEEDLSSIQDDQKDRRSVGGDTSGTSYVTAPSSANSSSIGDFTLYGSEDEMTEAHRPLGLVRRRAVRRRRRYDDTLEAHGWPTDSLSRSSSERSSARIRNSPYASTHVRFAGESLDRLTRDHAREPVRRLRSPPPFMSCEFNDI